MQTILVLLFETVWVCCFFFNIFHPQLIMDAEPLDTESWLYFLPGLRISLCLAWGPYNCETSFPYWEMWYTIKEVLEKKAPHISLPETNSSSCHPLVFPRKQIHLTWLPSYCMCLSIKLAFALLLMDLFALFTLYCHDVVTKGSIGMPCNFLSHSLVLDKLKVTLV